MTAAQEVRTSETAYVRRMEETIVFASTRKLLALGAVFDRRLRTLRDNVVEKFDKLDLFEARSQLQVDSFSFVLAMGVRETPLSNASRTSLRTPCERSTPRLCCR